MDFDTKNQEQTENKAIELSSFSEDLSLEPKKTVGFWEFFGLIVLFAIPVVGFIACIVFMFSPKRQTLKNYARAVFTWMAVRLVTTIAVVLLVLSIVGTMVMPAINSSLNTNFDGIFEVIDVAGSLMSGNYAKVIGILRPQLIEALGEESAPLIDELSNRQYNEMFEKIIDEDYDDLLEDFNRGRYSGLEEVVGKDEFNSLINELRKASRGEHSEFFDGLRGYLSIAK